MIKMDLIFFERVGPFRFGNHIKHYSSLPLSEVVEEYDVIVGWKVYKLKGNDIRIYTEKELITAIACYDECLYKDVNLIGMKFHDFTTFLSLIKVPECSKIEMVSGTQCVYDFDSLAIQVYVKNNKIVSITCSNR